MKHGNGAYTIPTLAIEMCLSSAKQNNWIGCCWSRLLEVKSCSDVRRPKIACIWHSVRDWWRAGNRWSWIRSHLSLGTEDVLIGLEETPNELDTEWRSSDFHRLISHPIWSRRRCVKSLWRSSMALSLWFRRQSSLYPSNSTPLMWGNDAIMLVIHVISHGAEEIPNVRTVH